MTRTLFIAAAWVLSTATITVGAQRLQPSVAEARQAQPSAAGNVDSGKRLFMNYYCYSCHGTEGQGGAGPRLVARATSESLIRYVRKPSGVMPAYTSKVISEQQLIDIHAYLRSIPPPPAAKAIPLLNQ
jgi:mono/diheme cytochrome c family protein